jgi:hypothetical protein
MMLDANAALIACAGAQEIQDAVSKVVDQLPRDLARQLRGVRNEYLIAYGWEGVFERFNGRTVAQILAEFQEPAHPPIVASGEIGGMRYTLHAPPDEKGGPPDKGGRKSD